MHDHAPCRSATAMMNRKQSVFTTFHQITLKLMTKAIRLNIKLFLEPLLKLSNDFDSICVKNGPWGPLQICKQPVPHIFDFDMFFYKNYSSLPKYLT